MTRPDARQGLAIGAAVVTIALTGAAFWLSYEHLHDVAAENGLSGVRAWAWPATVDLFIVAGELLMLRAALRNRVDPWAVALASTGSVGSIALNVAGVGTDAEVLEYIVAAVPPVAALLAFGALMRQVHERLAVTVPEESQQIALTAESAERSGDPVVTRRRPEVVPAGVDLLPLVAHEMTTTVTLERLDQHPEQAVTRPAVVDTWHPIDWSLLGSSVTTENAAKTTIVKASQEARKVVTVPVVITPSELRQQARRLNREVVNDTGRPVTIERLRDEYGLSRRDATDLRRHVVDGARS